MRPFAHLMLAMSLASLAAMPTARAQVDNDPTVYMISYIEVMPSATKQTAGLLKALLDASRKEPSALRFEVLQRTAPSSQFGVIEVWKDQKSDDAHEVSAANKAYRARLSPVGGALYDQRWYKAL